jgi:hypothetical protein
MFDKIAARAVYSGGIIMILSVVLSAYAMPRSVAHVISSEGLTQGKDRWHFSYDGYEQLGVRYGKKMLELNYKQ